ncbi:MAG: tyrosine-protein phosphatase [Tepidibacillus sp.]
MIDIHSHILPGLDDGAKNVEESLLMVKEAIEDGIHTIVATPHHMNGIYHHEKADIIHQVDLLNQRIKEEGYDITILPGSEIHAYGEFVTDLKNDRLLTFNNNQKYVFVEFPYDRVPMGAEQLIFEIQVAGFVPIIPHPERNRDFRENPNKLYQLVKRGALTQLTASSLLGTFGANIQKFAEEIVEHHLSHMIATDSHGIGKRGEKLKEAYQTLYNQFGAQLVNDYQDNVKRVIEGKDIYVDMPYRIERKKGLFGFFKRKSS